MERHQIVGSRIIRSQLQSLGQCRQRLNRQLMEMKKRGVPGQDSRAIPGCSMTLLQCRHLLEGRLHLALYEDLCSIQEVFFESWVLEVLPARDWPATIIGVRVPF